jgi:hypothetical protein
VSTFPVAGAQRILVGSASADLRVTLLDQDGNPADAVGTVTVDLVRVSTGTVLATGRATSDTSGSGTYTAALTAAECATLDVIQATWKAGTTVRATTEHRIVGGFLFSRPQLRAQEGIGSLSTFSDAALDTARDLVTDKFEDCTGVSWVPTFDLYRTVVRARTEVLVLPHRPIRAVRTITMDGTAIDLTTIDVDADAGLIAGRPFSGEMVIGFEHGYDGPPQDLRDAALQYARFKLLGDTSGISPRARTLANEFGNVTYSTAGRDYPTGLPDVDEVLIRRDHRLPGIG